MKELMRCVLWQTWMSACTTDRAALRTLAARTLTGPTDVSARKDSPRNAMDTQSCAKVAAILD